MQKQRHLVGDVAWPKNKPFARITFDFAVIKDVAGAPSTIVHREHASAA